MVKSSAAPGNEDSSSSGVSTTKLPQTVHHQRPVLNQSDGATDRVFLSSFLSFPLFCCPVISNRTENETDNQSTQSQSQTHTVTIKREDSVLLQSSSHLSSSGIESINQLLNNNGQCGKSSSSTHKTETKRHRHRLNLSSTASRQQQPSDLTCRLF